ncbi:MAG: hypothetical protein NVV83_12115 [Afipia sp.]|nr:hypothetical protein [Afipia sp.]
MRIIVVVAAGLGLAGCSSFSMPDMFKTAPPVVTVQLRSLPPGAEARTSTGQSCKTPCSVSVSAENNFTVTFALPKYQPETVPVQVVRDPANPGSSVVDPNPVYAELQLAPPAARGRKAAPKPAAPKAKRPKAAPAAEAPAQDTSPFPPPPGR